MRRFGFLISKLGAGGAERMIVNLANSFAREFANDAVVLIHFGSPDLGLVYPIHDSVDVHCLDDSKVRDGIRRRVFRYREINRLLRKLGRFEMIISFIPQANFLNVAMSLLHGHRAIVCERNVRNHPNNPRWTDEIRSLLYPLAHRVIFQTSEQADQYKS